MRDYEPFWDVVLIAAEFDAELVRTFTSRPMRVSEHSPWSRVEHPDRRLDDDVQSVVWENEMFLAVIDVIELGAPPAARRPTTEQPRRAGGVQGRPGTVVLWNLEERPIAAVGPARSIGCRPRA